MNLVINRIELLKFDGVILVKVIQFIKNIQINGPKLV